MHSVNTLPKVTPSEKRKAPYMVQMDNVSKVFSNGVTAVKNVNFNIKEGEFVSFVGPSGCGKSTIFKMISGLTNPTTGSIDFSDHADSGEGLDNNQVGFVFQDATLLPWRTVLKNVMLPLEFQKIPEREKRAKAYEVLELVGLKKYAASLPRQLSGGMKMRVSIARALVAKPKLLLMDEPFGALDEITRQDLQSELLRIWEKQQMTVLFITHNVFEAVFLSTKVAVMKANPGKIVSSVDVPLAFPRKDACRTTHEFNEVVDSVSHKLKL